MVLLEPTRKLTEPRLIVPDTRIFRATSSCAFAVNCARVVTVTVGPLPPPVVVPPTLAYPSAANTDGAIPQTIIASMPAIPFTNVFSDFIEVGVLMVGLYVQSPTAS